ncbi:MAG: SMC family ATPase [Nitrososphaeraceae archaeon]
MLLRKIVLHNIRSYKGETEITIPEGRVLFQGDIGSGKSTILSAIEFSLFGLGDIDGNSLLRLGETNGSVLLDFQVGSKNYRVFRSIARRSLGKVTQNEGYIVEGCEKIRYSVSEMKTRILKIININEKTQTRTTSAIYRYAIFTPQAMMKQILSESPERRLEILRRAFNIEDYSAARRNATIFLSWSNAEVRLRTELTRNLQEKETSLQKIKTRLGMLSADMKRHELEISELRKEANELRRKIKDLGEKKNLVLELRASLPHLNIIIKGKQDSLKKEHERLRIFKLELESLNCKDLVISDLKLAYDNYLSKKDILRQLDPAMRRYERLEKERSSVEQNLENTRRNLELEIERLTAERKAELKKINDDEIGVKEESKALQIEALELQKSVAQLPALREEYATFLSEISKYVTEVATIEEQILKKQKEVQNILKIGKDATCPMCRQKLDLEHVSKVKREFDEEKIGMDTPIRFLRNMIADYQRKTIEKRNIIRHLEVKEDYLTNVHRELGKIHEKGNSVVNRREALQLKDSAILESTRKLFDGNHSHEERKKLTEILSDVAVLSKDHEEHDEAKQTISKYEMEKIETRYIETSQELKRKLKLENEIESTIILIDNLKHELKSSMRELGERITLLKENEYTIRDLEVLERDSTRLENDISQIQQMISGKRSEVALLKSSLNELEKEIKDRKNLYKEKLILQQTNNWLEQCFIPAIQDIERYVLQSINDEFNQLFQRWFYILMETGDVSVDVDANFTPSVSLSGYSLSTNSLSGGEKTSVALAYRLALNTMLKKVAGMDNALLILDEPTDGFGKEQLTRLRQVLDELPSAQIIMVSHERELESYVDKVYRVTKDGNRSQVEVAAIS